MVIWLVAHSDTFYLERTAALAVDLHSLVRGVGDGAFAEDPAHVMEHPDDGGGNGRRRIMFCIPALGC